MLGKCSMLKSGNQCRYDRNKGGSDLDQDREEEKSRRYAQSVKLGCCTRR